MSLAIRVEGSTDVPVARKVLELAGWESPFAIIDMGGNVSMDNDLRGYNAAAKGSPWFILRDLDHDAPCPGALVATLLPQRQPLMCLRIAVRAGEAWLTADPETLAGFLHVSRAQIPGNPDGEDDPKLTMVGLARRSTKPTIKKAMLPLQGASRRVGPG